MADTTQIIETQLKVIDQATAALRKIAEGAGQTEKALNAAKQTGEGFTDKLFHGMKEVAGIAGVMGSALALKSAWDSTEKYVKSLKEVHELTGATVEQTDYLFSSARKAGVEYKQMEQVMFSLSRQGSMLEQMTAATAGKHAPLMAKKFANMGVVMDKGPVLALETMADALKKGKIDTADLMTQFRIPTGAANDFKGFLETLDKSTLAKIAKGDKSALAGLVTDETVSQFAQMEDAQHRIADSWNRIKVMVLSKLYPVFAGMAERFADRLESFIPKAVAFGEALAANMDRIVFAAKAFVAYMTAKKLLDTLTSMTSASGFIGKLAQGGIGAALGGGGGGGGLAALFAQLKGIGAVLWAAAGPLLAIAAVVAALALAWRAITKNVEGVGDRFFAVVNEIEARFAVFGDMIMSLFGSSGSFGGFLNDLLDWAGMLVASGINAVLTLFSATMLVIQASLATITQIGDPFTFLRQRLLAFVAVWGSHVFDPLMKMVQALGRVIAAAVRGDTLGMIQGGLSFVDETKKLGRLVDNFGSGLLDATTGALSDYGDKFMENMYKYEQAAQRKLAERAAPGRETPDKRPPSNNFDFRGSRFDITQNFAEGFDPDRIAVTFGNDLASLGEMRTQSGLAPAFSSR